jgi:hypothetical protein
LNKRFVFAANCWVAAIGLLASGTVSTAQLSGTSEHAYAASAVDAQPYSSSALPAEPEPAWLTADPSSAVVRRENGGWVPPDMAEHYGMLSRFSIGSGLSPVGIAVQGAVILNERADARLDSNWFLYDTGRFEVSGVNVDGNFHFTSATAKLDWYPTASVWRISPGVMLYNGNRMSGALRLNGGTNFNVNGKDYWSASANPVTGATPLTGNVRIGLNRNKPAFTITGGFGKFVPHSHRHWSFPTEFGVAFVGAPTLDVSLSGWACTDKKQTQCTDISDPNNPIGAQFQSNLNTAVAKWRKELSSVQIYPIVSTSFMYSFDLPSGR